MNIKNIFIALAAASMAVGFSCINTAYADESSSTADEAEILVSEDSIWGYTIQKDDETGEEYVSIEKYMGDETEVVIPDEIDGNSAKKIGDYVFYENERITKVTISENTEYFGNFPFFGCTSLKELAVDDKNDIYKAKDGVLFGDGNELLVCFPAGKTEEEYTIPDGVIALNPASFAVCKSLKKVNFPNSLERIGLYCFAECTSLNNVVIPENVKELGEFNFTGCTALTDITLPDSMHTIGPGAFFSCTALKSVEFPKYIMEIGQGAFVSTGFTEIEIPVTVQTIGYSAFGFTTDQSGQLLPMDNFIVKGATGSSAQSYCSEEGNEKITFEAIDEKYTDASTAQSDSEKKDGLKPGVIAGIVICCGAAVVIVAALCFSARSKRLKKSAENDDEGGSVSGEDENDDGSEV